LRSIAAAIMACLGVVALAWAPPGAAQQAGTQAAVVAHSVLLNKKAPQIRLLLDQNTLASTCGGSAFNVNTFISVDATASADVKVTAPGVGLIEEFTDQTGANIGPYHAKFPAFHILGFGGGLPPNTPITITVTTYTGANLTGAVNSVSSLSFNCTTGVVLASPTAELAIGVPALSDWALAATAALVLALGAAALRRDRRRA